MIEIQVNHFVEIQDHFPIVQNSLNELKHFYIGENLLDNVRRLIQETKKSENLFTEKQIIFMRIVYDEGAFDLVHQS